MDTDDERTPRVVVVSASLAESLWPGSEPLGRCLRLRSDTLPCSEVVGVAQDIRSGDIRNAGARQYYVTWSQYRGRVPGLLLVRTSGPATDVLQPIRKALQASAPGVYVRVRALDDIVATQTRSWAAGVRIFMCFGGLALLLATFGLFTVMTYDTAQRKGDLGVRMALGARAVDLGRLVLRKGGLLAGMGILLGVALSWLLAPRFEALLFDVSGRDPVAFGATGLVLAASALAATIGPALQASRVNAQEVLRSE